MCGRYALFSPPRTVALQFGLAHEPAYRPSYNITPGASVLAIRAEDSHARTAMLLRWGLVPSWARDPGIGHHLINARAEFLADKPAFRSAFRRHRCIVPADGFYEWTSSRGHRQPHYVHSSRGELFGFAALYERWHGPGGAIDSCTIVTLPANAALAALHDRMPAILSIEEYAHWLDPDHPEPTTLLRGLGTLPAQRLTTHPVSLRVNSMMNDDPRLIEPAALSEGELF